jgi:hypothetical protein
MIKINGNKKMKKISKKSKNTIVGGGENDNISIMNIAGKLALLRKISDLPIIKDVFKNSPFDKNKDDTHYKLEEFIKMKTGENVKVALQIIKYILMCLYLGEDECYYYLENYIRSKITLIGDTIYPNNDIAFLVTELDTYNIDEGNVNYKNYKVNADLLFHDLKSKIEKCINENYDDDIGKFLVTKYKYKLYLQETESNTGGKIDETKHNLYVPNEYYNSVTTKSIKDFIQEYNNNGKTNESYKRVKENNKNEEIINNIIANKADNDDIIVIMQNVDRVLLHQEKLTGTIIIGFLNSLCDAPSIYTDYEDHINQNVLNFNTMFFINLFIEKHVQEDLTEDTLAELLAHLRRSAIGFYDNKETFMELVKKSIIHNYKIDETSFKTNEKLLDKFSKIQAKADIKEWIKNKDCSDQNNKTGINQILFYSFVLYAGTTTTDNDKNKNIIQRLKNISKRRLKRFNIYYSKESKKVVVDNCNNIIDDIVLKKKYLDVFNLYTKQSIKKLERQQANKQYYISLFEKFITISDTVKIQSTSDQILKENYNNSITKYIEKYNSLNSTNQKNLTSYKL